MIDIDPQEPQAVHAVRVAKEIDGAQYDGGVPAVRVSGPEQARMALEAAEAAHVGSRIEGIDFAHMVLEASYDCHGANLALALSADDYALDDSYELVLAAPSPFPAEAGLMQPVVLIKSAHEVDDLCAISVLGSIDAQLRELAGAHFASLSDTVYVIEQPAG